MEIFLSVTVLPLPSLYLSLRKISLIFFRRIAPKTNPTWTAILAGQPQSTANFLERVDILVVDRGLTFQKKPTKRRRGLGSDIFLGAVSG